MVEIEEKKNRRKLVNKIRKRTAKIGVIGAGYVGLPTVALFAETGFTCVALDVKPELIAQLNKGQIKTNEPGLNALVCKNMKNGRLKAVLIDQLDFADIDIIMIAVQTPLGQKNEPCLQYLKKVLQKIGTAIKPGMLVILISTIPPNTMVKEVSPSLESMSGFKVEKHFFLSYVPERIAPGKAIKEFTEGTRLVGGFGPNSTKITVELFKTICKNLIETDVTTAEIAKLAENTFRDINIGFANELALLCEQFGTDVTTVVKLANTHPRVNIHNPGPGVGGPCLPKDPYFLTYSASLPIDIILTARKINDYMFKHMVHLIIKSLENAGKAIKDSVVAILGVAYKSNADDSRLSPAGPIISGLLKKGATVNVYDPYCNESFGAQKTVSLQDAVRNADCLAVITDHNEFYSLNLPEIKSLMKYNPAIVDGRRIVNPATAENLGFFYYGLGFGSYRE